VSTAKHQPTNQKVAGSIPGVAITGAVCVLLCVCALCMYSVCVHVPLYLSIQLCIRLCVFFMCTAIICISAPVSITTHL